MKQVGVVSAREKEVIYDEGSKYVTVFDPLDGSSNVDAGIPTGESLFYNIMCLPFYSIFCHVHYVGF